MIFWLLVVGVVSLSIGFVMGATFRQYRPIHAFRAEPGQTTGQFYWEWPPNPERLVGGIKYTPPPPEEDDDPDVIY